MPQKISNHKSEPVAWVSAKESFCGFPRLVFSETRKDGYKPLYAAPVEPVKSEPVAEVRVRPLQGNESTPRIDVEWLVRPTPGFLYTTPQPRLDVDLTDDEIKEIWSFGNGAIYFARAVIAKYKDKNK